MRRFKSSKTLAAAITLALTLGMTGTALGAGVAAYAGDNLTPDLSNYNDTTIVDSNYAAYGVYAVNGGSVTSTGSDVNITTNGGYNDSYGIAARNLSQKTIEAGGKITIGDNTHNVTINSSSDYYAYGILSEYKGSEVTINANKLTVNANSGLDSDGQAVGIWAMSSNANEDPNLNPTAKITINANDTVVNAHLAAENNNGGEYANIGIVAYSGSQVEINGNLSINPNEDSEKSTAISTRGNSTITINKNADSTVKLNGNINFDSGENRPSSGGVSNATVNINLSDSDSYLHGNTVLSGNPTKEGNQFSTNLTMTVANGAEWTASGEGPDGSTATNVINTLNVENGGTVNTGKTLTIYNALNETGDGSSVKVDEVNVGTRTLAGTTFTNPQTATANVGTGASLEGQKVTISTGSTLNADGTVNATDTMNVDGTLNVNNGGAVTANALNANSGGTVTVKAGGDLTSNNLTANNGSELNSEAGANVTLNDAKLENGAIINLQGTTTINDNLTNNAGGTISNLVLAEPTTTVTGSGTTRVKNISLNDSVPFQQGGTYRTLYSNNEDGGEGGLDVSGATVDVTGLSVTGAAGSLRAGQTSQMTLLDNNTGKALGDLKGAKSQTFTSGTTLQGTGIASKDGNDVVYKINVSNEAQPQTHRAVMAHTAGLTTVFGGFDYLDRAAESMRDNGVNGFAAIGGGEHRYDTGSDIKTNAWHAIAGVGVKNAAQSGSITEYGIFYDYGDGHYRTSDSTGRGDGKAIYKGGGLFGKYKFDNDIYLEGSFRAGRVKNTSNGLFRDNAGNRYDLKTNSNYTAYHLGVGKIYNLDENNSMDVYAKYFRTHVNADNFNAGGHYDLDGVTSSILRIGTRWNHQSGDWTHYLGVAYEHEFDGEARGTADGAKIKSSDISGSSARFELGTTLEKGNWLLNLNADAYAGQHKGYDGSITLGYKF